mgnify:CR=1 FL=1
MRPGSTFKALTAATLIDTGAQTPYSTVDAASFETFPNGARVRDAFVHPSYTYTLTGALIDSSNVAVSKFSERVSAQTRYDYLTDFGIGGGVEPQGSIDAVPDRVGAQQAGVLLGPEDVHQGADL